MADEHDKVEPQDASKQNSPIGGESNKIDADARGCYWNGKYYSEWSTVCQSPNLYRCENGSWALYGNC